MKLKVCKGVLSRVSQLGTRALDCPTVHQIYSRTHSACLPGIRVVEGFRLVICDLSGAPQTEAESLAESG